METVRRVRVEIDGDSSKLTQELREGDSAIRRFAARADSALGSQVGVEGLTAIATQAGAAGLAFTATTAALRGLGGAISTVNRLLRDNETAFTKVATIADQAAFPLDRIQEIAEQTASQFASSTASQAEALYQTISAGATEAADATEVLRQANRLSISGFAELDVTIDGLTTVLNAFSLSGQDSQRVADLFFKTLEVGKTSTEELAASIGRVAAIAANTGLTLEETLGAVATLSQTVETSEAVTQLRSALLAVVAPSQEAADIIRELGLEFSEADLRSKGLLQFLQDIRDSGITNEQLFKLVGRQEAYNAALGLTSANADRAAAALEKIEAAAGSVDRGFARVSDTVSFQSQRVASNLSVLAGQFGKAVSEAIGLKASLRGLADTLEGFTRAPVVIGFKVEADSLRPQIRERLEQPFEIHIQPAAGPNLAELITAPSAVPFAIPSLQGLQDSAQVQNREAIEGRVLDSLRMVVAAQQKATQDARKSLSELQKEYETEGAKVIAAAQRTFESLAQIQAADPSLTPQVEGIRAIVRARVEALSSGEKAEAEARARREEAEREALARRLSQQAITLNTEIANVHVSVGEQLKLVQDGERAKILTTNEAAARRVQIAVQATARIQAIEAKNLTQETENSIRAAQIRAAGLQNSIEKEVEIARIGHLTRLEEIRQLELRGVTDSNSLRIAAEHELQNQITEIQRVAAEERLEARRQDISSGIDAAQSLADSTLSIAQSVNNRSIEMSQSRAAMELAQQRDILLATTRDRRQRQKIEEQFNAAIAKTNEEAARKRFAAEKAFGISAAVINTALGVTKALTIGFPQGLVAAAVVAAAGIAQIVQISTQSYGSGGSAGGVPGAANAQASIDEAAEFTGSGSTEAQRETILLIGERGLDELVDALSDRVNGSDRVFINSDSRQAEEIRGGT